MRRRFAHVLAVPILLATTASAAPPAKKRLASPPRYSTMVQGWHTASVGAHAPVDDEGHPLLMLQALNSTDHGAFPAAGPLGGFSAEDLDEAGLILHDPRGGQRYPVEPRLVDLVFRIEQHFDAEEIRFLSGYRIPARSGASNHGKGRALDFVVPGASDADVAAYARTLGFVGVGIYPVSGFVHLDVRERSYFWSDSSGPGRRNRERGILGDLARSSDRDAALRGEIPVSSCALQFDVDVALRACVGHEAMTDDDDDPGD